MALGVRYNHLVEVRSRAVRRAPHHARGVGVGPSKRAARLLVEGLDPPDFVARDARLAQWLVSRDEVLAAPAAHRRLPRRKQLALLRLVLEDRVRRGSPRSVTMAQRPCLRRPAERLVALRDIRRRRRAAVAESRLCCHSSAARRGARIRRTQPVDKLVVPRVHAAVRAVEAERGGYAAERVCASLRLPTLSPSTRSRPSCGGHLRRRRAARQLATGSRKTEGDTA